MILLKNKVIIWDSIFIIITLILFITFQYLQIKKIVFAEITKTVTIKASLLFNADMDNSGRVDGMDLALLMFYFGKTESEYGSNSLKVNPDLNRDKIVDGEDLVILASHFGRKK